MTILLHGFWGQPADWNPVIARLPLGAKILAPDLYLDPALGPVSPLEDWVRAFWASIDREIGARPVDLVGYSMGGRLALNALMAEPGRTRRVLLLSTQPALPAAALNEREAWEEDWRHRFETAGWAELERAWEELPVFAGSNPAIRRKTRELRGLLGLSLVNWSPRRHPFTMADLRGLPAACEWAFGALDQKYVEVAKSLQELPVRGQITLLPQAGHRLPSDSAAFIGDWITRGLENGNLD
jgi:2-succinyl-6-hydroxy-2,4-cyclohexadiene-1-carboxylate synthase